jgi:tRNA U34 5-carboxymethylaminomethyl modifying GTPase MnmE/TrmE
MFSRKISEPNRVYYGRIVDKQGIIDEVVLTYFKGPRSFTGEDVVEISCHGSMLVANQIISLAISLGARLAQRGEFSSRAYYNNKIDLVQAEAINSLIKAVTPEQKQLALYSLKGETSNVLKPIIDGLADILSNIEVNIDYPEYMDIEVVTTDKIITSYIPSPVATLKTKKGVCYDIASLFAAMCKTQKIPCYIVKGDYNGTAHAWNNVYINNTWYKIDPSQKTFQLLPIK